jgi:hypothetical protein
MGVTSFEQHVQPHLRIWRKGKLRLIPVRELERFLTENSEPPLADRASVGRDSKMPPQRHRRPGAGAKEANSMAQHQPNQGGGK